MATANPITDVLRRAILDSGLSLLHIAKETGVQRASLSRFVRGKNSLRLDVTDKLATYFGLRLMTTGKKPNKKKAEE
jgi:plasmid maintenance system antidote protein VapI